MGFFDSGLGGISVLRSALRLLPEETYIYYGDSKNAPYGDRTEEEITRLTMACAHALVERGVKAMVIACNTATATCISAIRRELSLPVVSVEPAIKPACAAPGTGKVLMMATLATTRLQRYLDLQNRMPDPNRVINVPCPGLADRIEGGVFAADAFDDLLDRYLSPYWGTEVDGIVLGCTHYPFIKGAIARYAGAHFAGPCRLYDGNDATVRHLGDVLREKGMENAGGRGEVTFLTSGDPARVTPVFEMLLARGD